KNAEQETVPEPLRELFEKKRTRLSDHVTFLYDADADTATLEDKRIHRTYTIRLMKEEEPKEEGTEEENPEDETEDEEAEAAKEDAKKEEPAKPKYGVYTDRFDVVIAVLPSLLSQEEMTNFVKYIQDG